MPETTHLMDAPKFAKMKSTAYLINTSRGPVVDEAALVDALKNGVIAGAGLDVFEKEPEVHPGLIGLDNVVITPHTASGSIETRGKMATMAAENVLAALAGSNYIHHAAGMLENMNSVAAEQYVIDNEILGMTMRVLRGITVDDDSLALDVIDQVGPGGHYLTADHTVRHMRSEFYYPSRVVDRQGWERWQQAGGLDARERARQIAREIMATHQPEPLDPAVDRWIRDRFGIKI